MKKFFVLAIASIMCIGANAQLVKSRTLTVTKDKKTPVVWVDLGAGTTSGDWDTGTVVDLGIRFNKAFTESLSWDIVKIKAYSNTEEIGDCLSLQAMTGARYTSPLLFGEYGRAYANVMLGYGYNLDIEEGGLAYEIGAGVNLTRKIAVGLAYSSQGIKIQTYDGSTTANLGAISLRVSFGF